MTCSALFILNIDVRVRSSRLKTVLGFFDITHMRTLCNACLAYGFSPCSSGLCVKLSPNCVTWMGSYDNLIDRQCWAN